MAVVVCQCADVCALLLISVISTDIRGDAIVFVSQAERWNIGLLVMVELFIWTTGLLLSYVVHVNDGLAVDGPSAGNGAMTGEWKWSMLSLLALLHQHLFFTCIMHLGPASLFSTCSDICWWNDIYCCSNIVMCHDDACFGGIDHLKSAKAKTVHANRLTAAYIQRSTLHRKSSWQGETLIVFEMKLWLCWFLFIHSYFWQLIC